MGEREGIFQKDSLLMRSSGWLAERALSEGCRRSETGTLSAEEGSQPPVTCASALCPGPPRQTTAFGETVKRSKDTLRHSH